MKERDWQPLLDKIADCGNLTKACRELDLSKSLFLMDCGKDRELADRYARAREVGLDAEADRAIEEAVKATDAGLARVALDARKWYLSKLMPQKYGDKLALGGAADLPAIKTEALDTSGLDEATLRAIAAAKAKDG